MKTEANSTAGTAFGWVVTGFLAVLAIMGLVKIGLVWFT